MYTYTYTYAYIYIYIHICLSIYLSAYLPIYLYLLTLSISVYIYIFLYIYQDIQYIQYIYIYYNVWDIQHVQVESRVYIYICLKNKDINTCLFVVYGLNFVINSGTKWGTICSTMKIAKIKYINLLCANMTCFVIRSRIIYSNDSMSF